MTSSTQAASLNATSSALTSYQSNQVMVSKPMMVSLIAMSILIVIGNGLVCIAFIYNRRLRSITNHFVVSLAVSDLLVGAILVPFYINNSDDVHIVPPMIIFNLVASLANICGCTYDRYIAIECPLRYKSILTKRRIAFILTIVWITPVLLAPIPKIWELEGRKLGFTKSSLILATRIYIGIITFGILLACILLASVYINLFRVARRHMSAMQYLQKFQNKENGKKDSMKSNAGGKRRFSVRFLVKEIRATKLFAVVGLTFILCWLPLVYINLADVLKLTGMYTPAFQIIALYTIFGNSIINPMIYAFFQKTFRLTVRGWFECMTSKCSTLRGRDQSRNKTRKNQYSGFELVFKEENGVSDKDGPDISKPNDIQQRSGSVGTESKV
uniref:Biogenic amine-like GPCR n=1 Tax=Tripedalia cystophora TaxID=6141 RepID=A0A481ZLQ9_TRICY|nr:biogenic amine-like GPCR [Tripedalia cystophora]